MEKRLIWINSAIVALSTTNGLLLTVTRSITPMSSSDINGLDYNLIYEKLKTISKKTKPIDTVFEIRFDAFDFTDHIILKRTNYSYHEMIDMIKDNPSIKLTGVEFICALEPESIDRKLNLSFGEYNVVISENDIIKYKNEYNKMLFIIEDYTNMPIGTFTNGKIDFIGL